MPEEFPFSEFLFSFQNAETVSEGECFPLSLFEKEIEERQKKLIPEYELFKKITVDDAASWLKLPVIIRNLCRNNRVFFLHQLFCLSQQHIEQWRGVGPIRMQQIKLFHQDVKYRAIWYISEYKRRVCMRSIPEVEIEKYMDDYSLFKLFLQRLIEILAEENRLRDAQVLALYYGVGAPALSIRDMADVLMYTERYCRMMIKRLNEWLIQLLCGKSVSNYSASQRVMMIPMHLKKKCYKPVRFFNKDDDFQMRFWDLFGYDVYIYENLELLSQKKIILIPGSDKQSYAMVTERLQRLFKKKRGWYELDEIQFAYESRFGKDRTNKFLPSILKFHPSFVYHKENGRFLCRVKGMTDQLSGELFF